MYVTHIECDLLSNLGGTADIMLRPFWGGAFLLWKRVFRSHNTILRAKISFGIVFTSFIM